MSKLYNLVEEEIHVFLYNLSLEYNLDLGDIHYRWDLFINDESPKELKKETDKEESNRHINNNNNEKYKRCKYMYTRGKKTNTVCGSKILNSDNDYCSKHIKYDKNKDDKNDEDKEITEKSDSDNQNGQIIILMNKLINKFVHKETGFVFFSREKLYVYARLINDELYKLTDEDVSICKLYRFKCDPSLYNEDELKDELNRDS
jgi:hypothetical protein